MYRESTSYLAVGWTRYIRIQQVVYSISDEQVVALALKSIEALGDLQSPPSPSIGHSLTSGEQPLAQACILYVLQTAVIPYIQEPALRSFLSDLGEMCSTLLRAADARGSSSSQAVSPRKCPLDSSNPTTLPLRLVPQAVVALATLGRVLHELGELPAGRGAVLRDAVHALMMSSDTAVNYAGASVLGQLAIAEGGSASRLMMEYMSLATLQAASLGDQAGSILCNIHCVCQCINLARVLVRLPPV